MKNALYVIAGLLLIIWAIVYFNYETGGQIHILLAVTAFILLARIIFDKKFT